MMIRVTIKCDWCDMSQEIEIPKGKFNVAYHGINPPTIELNVLQPVGWSWHEDGTTLRAMCPRCDNRCASPR